MTMLFRFRHVAAAWAIFGLFIPSLPGQEVRPPNSDDVAALKKLFGEEKSKVLREGADKQFLAGLVERADDMVRKADIALNGGRFLQAAELYRQARWQLPYVPTKMPEHVTRVFGNFRMRHGMEITAVAYSADGKLLATGSTDRTVKIWDLANGHELRTYQGHADQVRTLAFSPDGKTIASAGAESNIRLWDPHTGKDYRQLAGPGNYVKAVAFSRDGKHLAAGHSGKAGGSAGSVTLHEVATGELKRTFQDFRLQVETVAFSDQGGYLAVGVGDGLTRLYEYPQIITNPNQPEFWGQQDDNGATYHVSFSPDGRRLIRCGAEAIKIYQLPQPGQAFQVSTPQRIIPRPVPDQHFQVALVTSDSKTLVTGAKDGIIRLYDLESGQIVSTLRGHTGPIKSLALHPMGNQIVSAGSDFMVRLWDFDLVLQARDYAGHEGPVWSAAFSPDGTKIVSASADQTLRVWEVGTAKTLHTLKGHAGPTTMAIFTPDGKRILSAAADRLIKVWDAETGAPVRDLTGHAGTITAMDVSPDGKTLASGGADRLVKLWDLETGKDIITVEGHSSVVAGIAFHPDGKLIAVGNVDQTICLYDLDGKLKNRWAAHGIAVSGVAFSPNGKLLASCGADNVVRVWSLANPGQNPITLSGHGGPLSSVAFRKDSQHLVSCGADLSVKLWKLEGDASKELQTYRGHRDWVTSVAFSQDGYYVASSSVDRLVKIWEITSKDLPLLPEHTGAVDTVVFSPDGAKIASGGSDKTIKIWDRNTGLELATIRGHTSNIIALVFTPDSKTLISSSTDRSIRFWDPANGKELPRSTTQQQSFTGLIAAAPLLSITPDGKTLLAWIPGDHRYTTLAGFDLEGNERFTFNDQGRKVHSLCFSGQGKHAATGAENGTVRLWDLDKKAPHPGGDWLFFDEKTSVADLALTPDGNTIIVTSEAGDIKIADVAKRTITKSFKGHPSRISACLISPDGKRFVTMDADNRIKLWDLAKAEELRQWDLSALMRDRAATVLSLAFAPDGRGLAVGTANTTLLLLQGP